MNVTELAERIVFGKTLDDKLLVPDRLSHARPSQFPNVDSLITPGRPVGLEMRTDQGGNIQPPSDDRLENEAARGQLLHFLANHELLATELMALVLLKFPDAPHAFRAGVLVTLQEEQAHTRMYIQRMKECGVEFGQYPLSGQFWRVVEPMQGPMDFVSRLSLTFEQANLDYSLHFANVFRKLGDTVTADVLQKIYEDEIGHVQHGLHWFRKWKNPDHSDWEAYQQSLQFPMSPQRGRGPRGVFNREGRVQAGLTQNFIDAIEVFRQSRGRAPRVHWFDPAAEQELALGKATLPRKSAGMLEQLGADLELLMIAMAKQDDVVLVRKMPSRHFCKRLIDAGFELPEFKRLDDRASLLERKLHDVSPWAWTPKNFEIAQSLDSVVHVSPGAWNESWRDLYRKSWGATRLREWLENTRIESQLPQWFTPVTCVGVPVSDGDEIKHAVDQFESRNFERVLFKSDLAAAGRGQRRISSTDLGLPFDEENCSGVVEPELNKVVDLSFLWHLPQDAEQANFLGWTRPLVAGRRFVGTRFGTVFHDCDQRLKRSLLADRCARIQTVVDWLQPRITSELRERNFSGYFGVDALVCQNPDGELQIKPLVELNPRMTMGHVALQLAKRLEPGAEAEFRIFTKVQWEAVHEDLDRLPLTTIRDGRWKSGVVWLGEVDVATKLIPAMVIGGEAIERSRVVA